MLSIFLIGVALSMDAFSIALSIGTTHLSKNRFILIPIVVSIMHFVMPLIGLFLGNQILSVININPKIIMTIILLYLAFLMYKDRNNDKVTKINSLLSIFLYAISVSLDSFSVGIGLKALTDKILIPPIIFSLCAGTITYMGLILGKYSQKVWQEKASLIGIILLIFFLALYLSSYNTSYYENKNILTEDAIKRFEKDLKEGKKINVNNYIEKEKNYNNKVSTYTLKLSNLIDKCINKSLKLVLKYLENSNI